MPLTHLVQLQVKNNQTPSKASIHCPLCSGGRARTALGLSSSSHSPFLSPHTQEMAKATHHCNWGCVRRLSSCWKQYEFCCFSPPGFCCFPWQLSARMQQGTLYLQEPPPPHRHCFIPHRAAWCSRTDQLLAVSARGAALLAARYPNAAQKTELFMPSGAFLGFSALWPPLACTQHASEPWGGKKPILQMQSGDSPRQLLVRLVAQLEMANPRFSKVPHIIHQHPHSRHSPSPHITPMSPHLWEPGLPSSALPRAP